MSLLPLQFSRLGVINLVALLMLILLGLVAGIGGMPVLLGLLGIGILILMLLLLRFKPNTADLLLMGAFAGFWIFPLVGRFIKPGLFAYWQFYMVGASLVGIPFFLRSLKDRNNFWMYLALSSFAIFLLCGLMSTMYGHTTTIPAVAFQLFADFKPFLLIIFGFGVRWDKVTEKSVWTMINTVWFFMLVFVLWEWASPAAYYGLFTKIDFSADPANFFPSRAVGFFEHSSMLASASANLAILCAIRMFMNQQFDRKSLFFLIMYLLMLVCSVQRQELLSAVACLGLILMLIKPERVRINTLLAVSAMVVLLGTFWIVFSDNMTKEASTWGLGEGGHVEHPRAQIFAGSVLLADKNFPLGSGLGTYGGAGAEKYNQAVYEELGFKNYWWYGRENYLMDMYWPNPIAEAGYIGSGFLLLAYFFLFAHAVSRALKNTGPPRAYWLGAASSMLYMLQLSMSSPSFQDARLLFIPALLYGWANAKEKEQADATS